MYSLSSVFIRGPEWGHIGCSEVQLESKYDGTCEDSRSVPLKKTWNGINKGILCSLPCSGSARWRAASARSFTCLAAWEAKIPTTWSKGKWPPASRSSTTTRWEGRCVERVCVSTKVRWMLKQKEDIHVTSAVAALLTQRRRVWCHNRRSNNCNLIQPS